MVPAPVNHWLYSDFSTNCLSSFPSSSSCFLVTVEIIKEFPASAYLCLINCYDLSWKALSGCSCVGIKEHCDCLHCVLLPFKEGTAEQLGPVPLLCYSPALLSTGEEVWVAKMIFKATLNFVLFQALEAVVDRAGQWHKLWLDCAGLVTDEDCRNIAHSSYTSSFHWHVACAWRSSVGGTEYAVIVLCQPWIHTHTKNSSAFHIVL